MLPTLEAFYGNPSSMHSFGQAARQQVETARKLVAEGIGAKPEEVIFTSGATEANNIALVGTMLALPKEKNHLIVSAIEHHAVLHTAKALAARGFEVTYLPVDHHGLVSPEELESNIQPETGLISIMMVNNEVGSVQDITEIGRIAWDHEVLFHTDAVQAVNCFKINVDDLHVDLLSLSAHKIYGPKGVGALYLRQGTNVEPILFGGSQEKKYRPGTENVPAIVGLGTAMSLRNDDFSLRFDNFKRIRKELIEGLHQHVTGVVVNGPEDQIAPHIVSITFPNVNGELMLFHLNQAGVAVSMGSACTSESIEPSHVLSAMGLLDEQIEGTLRISIGTPTTFEDVHQLIEIICDVVDKAKN
jgi:cysteine desulfurase